MTSFLGRLYAFNVFDSFILILPLYTVMFADQGLTPVDITLCLAAWSTTIFVLQVPSGVIADRWSRRHILAFAQLVRAIGLAVWLLYPHFWGLLAGLVLWGVKSAFTSGTFEALLYDELKARGRADDYTRIFGRSRAIDAVGDLLAALAAAVVVRFGYGPTVVASIVSAVLAAIAAASLPAAPMTPIARERHYLADLRLGLAASLRAPTVLRILLFLAVILALGGALEEFWPIFGAKVGLSRSTIAVFVGAQNAGVILASLIAFRLAALPASMFHALLAGCGLLLMIAAGLFTGSAMVLLLIYSGAMKLIGVVFEGRLQHAITSDHRATIGSVKSLIAQIGIIALYLSFGPLAQSTSYRIALMACGGGGIAIGLAYLTLSRKPRAPARPH